MLRQPKYGLFIAGTNTDAGKTYVASLIAKQLRSEGVRVGVYKPVASGCEDKPSGERVSEDAVQLWEAAGKPLSLKEVCPQQFLQPITPHLAAIAEGKTLDRDLIRSGISVWADQCDIVIVEGAGGLMSPLNEEEYFADVAADFGYPLIVVVPNLIGAINQTLQTLITAKNFKSGLPVAGVVLNDVVADSGPSASSNRQQIADRTKIPVLAHVAYREEKFADKVDWFKIAKSTSFEN